MFTRRNLAFIVLCAVLGSAALAIAALSTPTASAGTGGVVFVALYGLLFSAALCFCGLVLGRAFELSPFSSERRTGAAFAPRGALPVVGSIVLLIVLWFVGGAVLKRILLANPPSALEAATAAARQLLTDAAKSEQERLGRIAAVIAKASETSPDPGAGTELPLRALALGAGAAWTLTPEGRVRWGLGLRGFSPKRGSYTVETEPLAPDLVETLSNGLEVWEVDDKYFIGVAASLPQGRLVAARRVPRAWIEQWKQVEAASGIAAQRDRPLARQAAWLNALLYLLVFLSLGGVVVFARNKSAEA